MNDHRLYAMSFAVVYPLYVAKAVRKGRTRSNVNEIIHWLTGYNESALEAQVRNGVSLERFFAQAPRLNPLRKTITGMVCGVRVEEIKEPTMQEIRYLDKLIDELANGKTMDKILRK